ncbi:MAG: adenylyltransferase/cytidyltransferase family protein, partial [Bacteroidaceae bacterium]
MKIGIFGGSFNPIHNGHIALANELCSRGEIDKIWLLVSPQNPLKNKEDLMPEQDRLMMVELATKEYPDINVSIRGAISIARRLQDPMAELVKIDPKNKNVTLKSGKKIDFDVVSFDTGSELKIDNKYLDKERIIGIKPLT